MDRKCKFIFAVAALSLATLSLVCGCESIGNIMSCKTAQEESAICMTFGAESEATNIHEAQVETNYFVVSDVQLNKMWMRQPVMVTSDDEIIDASHTLASYTDAIAQSNAIANLSQISEAASVAMTNAIEHLLEHTNRVQTSARHISMFFKPDTLNSNLAAYVVHETTDGITDTQYVWYNCELALAPTRYVDYVTSSETNTVKCKWLDWNAAGETITVNGNTWNGVHRCAITRPVALRYEMCRTTKNDTWGSDNGFEFGSMNVFVNGQLAYTGVVSNVEENAVLTFKHGAFMSQTTITNVVEEASGGGDSEE